LAGKFEIYEDDEGEFRFLLKAGSGEVVAVGNTFPTKDAAKRGIAEVLKAAAGAKIVDQADQD
jgi:uncharacterized protein